LTLSGPGKTEEVTLAAYRKGRSDQELAFHLSRDLTRRYQGERGENAPPHVLFPQILRIVERYIAARRANDDCPISSRRRRPGKMRRRRGSTGARTSA
jgi:hypothetical protein